MLLKTDASYYRQKGAWKVKAEAKAMFKAILKAEGGADYDSSEVDRDFVKKTQKVVRILGGINNVFREDKLEHWVDTVPENPWLYKGRLVRVSEFIKEASKRRGMERAIEVHLDKARLVATQVLIKAKMAQMEGDASGALDELQRYV